MKWFSSEALKNGCGIGCWLHPTPPAALAGYAIARMANATSRAPWHLWLIGVIAVLFNSIGVFDFVMVMAQGAKYMASAGMTPEQIAHYQQMPVWMTAVWAV